jgi:hypothetical protein
MDAHYYITLDLLPAAAIMLLLLILGYWLGSLKTRKLTRQLAKMERKVMELNTELLYGSTGTK